MPTENQNSYQIDFEPIGKRIRVSPETTLLEAAQQAGVLLTSTCGSHGKCGQCIVTVMTGPVSEPSEKERKLLSQQRLDEGLRLACATQVLGDVKVHIPATSLESGARLQLAGEEVNAVLDSPIQCHDITAPSPSLKDNRADLQRIGTAISKGTGKNGFYAESAVVRQISPAAREHKWSCRVFLRGSEIIGLAPTHAHPLGVAVDLGTTKVAVSLLDLTTGRELAVSGALNPQIAYGEDVISRLTYARREAEGANRLTAKIRQTIDELIGVVTASAGAHRHQITDLCIVGNTAMTHLLLALPVDQMVSAPYVAATSAPVDIKAHELDLKAAPGAYVHILPCIGGFVGADHVAMILASRIDHSPHTTMGIDIGTNSEIVLVKPELQRLYCASCASGPAFEGGHISDGMRAASGAIESVTLTATGCALQTIDNAPAVGLCGSGIIDALAELHRWHIINERGRLDKNNPRVRVSGNHPEFVLADKAGNGGGRDVIITQEDINQIQLAKGAIRGGLDSLVAITETDPQTVREVIIAGAFGAFLDVGNALDIGLLPYFPNAHYRQVGNAALVGAQRTLLSMAERRHARQIADHSSHLELATYPGFNRLFAQGMLFPQERIFQQPVSMM
jgi:uncharacterized 2Fe-2S/4Fe-4S cluster protein (DUF4445 family)